MIGKLLQFNHLQNEHNSSYTGLIIIVEKIMPEREKVVGRHYMINHHKRATPSIDSEYIKRFDFI